MLTYEELLINYESVVKVKEDDFSKRDFLKGCKGLYKNGKIAIDKRIVTETKDLKNKFEEVQKQQKILWLQSGKSIDFKFVCSWDDGRPLRPLYITKTFTKFEFKKITFHGLRRTHASTLYSNGAISHEISKRLRHSGVATTDDIYIHITQDIKNLLLIYLVKQ